ncbi:hypothetical protein D3C87_1921010 [compost metagenome]
MAFPITRFRVHRSKCFHVSFDEIRDCFFQTYRSFFTVTKCSHLDTFDQGASIAFSSIEQCTSRVADRGNRLAGGNERFNQRHRIGVIA